MREIAKAGKIIPTSKEFSKLLNRKSGMPNLIFTGVRDANDGSFRYSAGNVTAFWTSTEKGNCAWSHGFYSNFGTGVSRKAYANCKKNGFSVRCLKD